MRRTDTRAYYPISLNINGKKCVVVGGGEVAWRKVRTLLEHGAEVTVISPRCCAGIVALAEQGEVQLLRRPYETGDLADALIAIAATANRKTNQEIVAEARNKAVLVNVVDDAALSDFIVPSCLRRGEVTVAVSTSGLSPALARKIRLKLEEDLGEEYTALAKLVGAVRADQQRAGIRVNGSAWERALDLELLTDLLRRGDTGEAKTVLLDSLRGQGK